MLHIATISRNELKDLDINKIPNKLKFSLKNSIARNKQFALFQVSPIIKDANGGFKKITSFTINYTTVSSNSRSALSKTSKLVRCY